MIVKFQAECKNTNIESVQLRTSSSGINQSIVVPIDGEWHEEFVTNQNDYAIWSNYGTRDGQIITPSNSSYYPLVYLIDTDIEVECRTCRRSVQTDIVKVIWKIKQI